MYAAKKGYPGSVGFETDPPILMLKNTNSAVKILIKWF